MPLKTARGALRPYLIAAAIAALIFLLHTFHLINFHELDGFDLRLKIRGERVAHPKIVLLEIDDASVAAVGQWPWPRSVHAVLLDILGKYDPKLIFFDVLFTENGPVPEHDENFAAAVKNAGNVILPFYYYSEDPFGAFFPIDPFREAAVATGFVNVEPDRDGVVRRFKTYVRPEEEIYYHPSVLAMFYRMQDGKKAQEWFSSLPVDRRGRLWINYPGSLRNFKRISFWEVIDAAGGEKTQQLLDLFQGSIVLIGHTATGTTDLKATPFVPLEPGVAIQASAIHTLLTGKYFRESPWYADLFLFLVLALATTWLSQKFPPKQALGFAALGAVGYILVNAAVFVFLYVILPLFVPLAVIAVTYFVMLFINYIEARFQEELIHRELQTAARIQENFLPEAHPELAGLDVQFQCRFIKEVGGDLFDWTDLEEGKLGLCVGDVSGKGVPAALYMAKAISEFRRDKKTGVAPGQVNASLNDHLARSGTAGMFLTFFYAVIDTGAKKIFFSSGGHEPMIFFRTREGKAELVHEPQGTPLGLFEGAEFESGEFSYESGDLLVVVTDGIKELRNPKREEFGMERLKTAVEAQAAQAKSSQDLISEIFKVLEDFQKGQPPHDDRTILCVRFL